VIDDAVPLVDGYGRRIEHGAAVTALVWPGDRVWFALGDGRLSAVPLAGEAAEVAAHDGAILCAAAHPDGRSVVSGGDDGRLLKVATDGAVEELGDFGSKWVSHVVASPASGAIVAGVGREAVVWTRGAAEPSHRFVYPSTVGGLALDAKGRRLAASHYNGATLTYVLNAGSGRQELVWAGSHLACTLSPDAGYLVTACQETGLHGWKLPIGADMAMRGYKAKTRSFSWSRTGKWLATSGDSAVICWPFDGKTGPMNRKPAVVGAGAALVTQVAFHPAEEILAVGYADGAVALTRVADDAYTIVQEASGEPVSALGWSGDGSALAWGGEDGRGGLLDMRKRA
jgi:WD40 repeat protein